LNRSGFAGEMSKPTFGVTARDPSNLVLWLKNITQWTNELHERLRYAYIENLNWDELIERWDKSKPGPLGAVFFLDPPYIDTREYATGTLTEDEHRKLSSTLGSIRGRFLLTINDHPLIRSLYDGCYILECTKQYSISKSSDARKAYAELIISNYPLPEQKQARLF
jgi:DNA adenine methylase